MTVSTSLARFAVAALAVCAANRAVAQTYPSKPIRMVVSIAAGRVTDVIMRAAASELSPRLGQQLVIENRGGAAGILGGQTCAAAQGDGYTICIIYHSTLSYNPLLFDKLPYDADKDFVPVTRLFFLTEGVFVSNAINVSSIAELKTLATAKPDGLNYATLGEGSFPDLFMRWLNNQWGTRIVGVPYRGGGPAAQALAANEVQVTRFGVGNFTGLLEGGKSRRSQSQPTSARRSSPTCRRSLRPGWAAIRARAGGASPRQRARRPRSWPGSMRNLCGCSKSRNSSSSWTGKPWNRPPPHRKPLPNSSRRTGGRRKV
jgi:tripartite-type tricarboxylate transporter receptor subunit TctC